MIKSRGPVEQRLRYAPDGPVAHFARDIDYEASLAFVLLEFMRESLMLREGGLTQALQRRRIRHREHQFAHALATFGAFQHVRPPATTPTKELT
jgi:hypothetical protein